LSKSYNGSIGFLEEILSLKYNTKNKDVPTKIARLFLKFVSKKNENPYEVKLAIKRTRSNTYRIIKEVSKK
jgi:hypothetical protein